MLYEIGKINGTSGQNTITGISTQWLNSITPIEKGNTLVIYGTGGTTDVYGISSVDSDTKITLTRPLTQTFTEKDYGIMISDTASVSQFSNQLQRTLAALIVGAESKDSVIKEILDDVFLRDNLFNELTTDAQRKTARDNLGIINTVDALLKSNNLSDVANLTEAQANLQVFKQLPDLTANDNLNDLWQIKDVGIRTCPSSSYSTFEKNYPIQRAGTLILTPVGNKGYIQIYISSVGDMFHRAITSINPLTWSEWTSYANLNLPNTFTVAPASKVNGASFIAMPSILGQAAFYAVRDADNSSVGYVGKGGTSNDFVMMNQKSGKSLNIRADGLLAYTDGYILHTGNAGTATGIGAVHTKLSTTFKSLDSIVTGSELDPYLPGSWRAMKVSSQDIAGVIFFCQSFVRIA